MFVFISSEEEQFFINAQLPDFHQVDIPDLWIGISGEWYNTTFYPSKTDPNPYQKKFFECFYYRK